MSATCAITDIHCMNFKEISELFGNPSIPVSKKIRLMVEAMALPNKNIAIYSKMLCWLAYRDLTGYVVPIEDVKKEILNQLVVLKETAPRTKYIWTQSLNMVMGYLSIKENNITQALVYFKNSVESYNNEVNPGGITNAMRAGLLLGYDMMIPYQYAVSLFPHDKEPWLIECLTKASRCLEIEAWLKKKNKKAFEIEREEPFSSLFEKAHRLKYKLEEDQKYSALYQKGYGDAQPIRVVEAVGCKPEEVTLDLGCGHAVLSNYFTDYTGVDVSSYVIEDNKQKKGKYIHSSLHEYQDERRYDNIISTDVLEHLPEDIIDQTLQSIINLKANRFIFSISCRPSVTLSLKGEQLHLTVKEPSWWKAKLMNYFDTVEVKVEKPTWIVVVAKHTL